MATIDMSPAFGTSYTTRMLGLGTSVLANTTNTLGAAAKSPLLNSYVGSNGTTPMYSADIASNTYLWIMKGTAPTSFATLGGDTTTRPASDILVQYTTGHNAAADFAPSIATLNPATISTNYVAASGTGLASWFWLFQRRYGSGNAGDIGGSWTLTTALFHQVVGTVGTVGSGADLEIPDTNIVSGNAYRILNLRLQFPTTWTFA